MGLICAENIDSIKNVSGVSVSPAGEMLAFCVFGTCMEKNTSESDLYVYELAGGILRRITECGYIWSFCFDKDGMLLYPICGSGGVNPSDKSTEFWRANPTTGATEKAFTVPLSGAKATLLAGTRFVVKAPWDLELERLLAEGDELAVAAHKNGDVQVCDELPYRIDGRGYVNKLRERLFEYNCESGALIPITPPTFQQIDYSVNGGCVYVLGEDYSVKSARAHSVYRWDGKTFTLCAPCSDMLCALAVSDGRIYAASEPLTEVDSYLYTANEGEELKPEFKACHTLFNAISTDITSFGGREFYAKDGKLYYTMQNRKGVRLYLWENGRQTALSPDGVDILHFDIADDGRVFAAALPELGSAEVFELLPEKAVPLTAIGKTALAGFTFTKPEHLVFESSDGCEIDGWVLKPAGFTPEKRYPAILNIHGGPQLRYYGGFSFEQQNWAAHGYFVMYCNPHGSIGDDPQFSNIRQKYATIDYDDIMRFVDTVLVRYPQIDEKRMGVTGISYGGFMTNWIVTHNSRFAAAASQAGISDWVGLHATDDTPGFDYTITGSMPWENTEEHLRISPLIYAASCKTPTLFIESGDDYRCPVDQGLGMYQALMELGVPTRAIILRGETHCVFRNGKPRNRVRISREILDWFNKYIPKE